MASEPVGSSPDRPKTALADLRWALSDLESPPWHHPTGIADLTLDSAIKRHVAMVLAYCRGNLQWAADELGIDDSTLFRWRKQWVTESPRSWYRKKKP